MPRPTKRTEPSLTPRQAEVLDLARIGLSDDEIAARLRLSARSVRFVFEKVFLELGVRERAEAVAVWSGTRRHKSRYLDRCPYDRPFRATFDDCPAYRAVRSAMLDTQDRPTGSLWTCHHLDSRLIPETEEGWYAGCAIGGPAAREQWAAEVAGPERLRAMNEIARELALITGPAVQRLWRLKQEQRRALQRPSGADEVTLEMEHLRDRLLAEVEALLRRRRSSLERNRLSAGACLDVARRAIDGLLPPQVPATWSVRFDVLLGLPEEAWLG